MPAPTNRSTANRHAPDDLAVRAQAAEAKALEAADAKEFQAALEARALEDAIRHKPPTKPEPIADDVQISVSISAHRWRGRPISVIVSPEDDAV